MVYNACNTPHTVNANSTNRSHHTNSTSHNAYHTVNTDGSHGSNRMSNTLRVSVAMQKGGVGKTTTTINLAGALARRGHNVLLIDVDPQGYATKSLGFRDIHLSDHDSQYDLWLNDERFGELDELIVEHDEFDVVPSHLRMFKLEKELYSTRRAEERLDLILNAMDRDYDMILLDSPPNLGPLTDNTIIAAEHVLFPAHAHVASKDSLEMLFDEISSIERTFEREILTLGTVVNMTTQDGMSWDMMDWFEDQFGEEYVFEIPKRVDLQYAWKENCSIFGYYEAEEDKETEPPYDDVRDNYLGLAEHVEGQR